MKNFQIWSILSFSSTIGIAVLQHVVWLRILTDCYSEWKSGLHTFLKTKMFMCNPYTSSCTWINEYSSSLVRFFKVFFRCISVFRTSHSSRVLHIKNMQSLHEQIVTFQRENVLLTELCFMYYYMKRTWILRTCSLKKIKYIEGYILSLPIESRSLRSVHGLRN